VEHDARELRAASGVVGLLPYIRGADAAYRAAQVLRAGGDLPAAYGTAQTAMKGYGPVAKLEAHVGKRMAGQSPTAARLLRLHGVRTTAPLGPRPPVIGMLGKGFDRGLYNTGAAQEGAHQYVGAVRQIPAQIRQARNQRRFKNVANRIAAHQP
jgi:hypothetical protein